MKLAILCGLLLCVSACQILPTSQDISVAAQPAIEVNNQLPDKVAAIQPAPAAQLLVNDDASTLQSWVSYRANLLDHPDTERQRLNSEAVVDQSWQLKRTMLQLHPDTPYLTRLRVHMQAPEQLAKLPESLAALLSWDLAFNQKLLEAESAVSALTRLNSQQQDTIERLQKSNRELQKKIDALTQIEAQLNQTPAASGGNNGQR